TGATRALRKLAFTEGHGFGSSCKGRAKQKKLVRAAHAVRVEGAPEGQKNEPFDLQPHHRSVLRRSYPRERQLSYLTHDRAWPQDVAAEMGRILRSPPSTKLRTCSPHTASALRPSRW